jgi:hypothetical protein
MITVTAHNLKIIGANEILGTVDLKVAPRRITFRRCRWKREGNRKVVRFACDDVDFWSHGDAAQFRRAKNRKSANPARSDENGNLHAGRTVV